MHIYNNYYNETNEGGYYQYNWGAGVESRIVAENNYFELGEGIDAASIIYNWGGTNLEASGSLVNGSSQHDRVDLVAAHNAQSETALEGSVSGPRAPHERIDPTPSVPNRVLSQAGSGSLR